jgi:hypothetical protein
MKDEYGNKKGNAIGHSRKVMALSKRIYLKPIHKPKTWPRRIFNIAESNTSAKGPQSFREQRTDEKGWQLSVPA